MHLHYRKEVKVKVTSVYGKCRLKFAENEDGGYGELRIRPILVHFLLKLRAHSFAAYAYSRRICPLEFFIVF